MYVSVCRSNRTITALIVTPAFGGMSALSPWPGAQARLRVESVRAAPITMLTNIEFRFPRLIHD